MAIVLLAAEIIKFPNVPLLPPIALVPLKVTLPEPVEVCIALFVSVPVTVTVLPKRPSPSLNVPEVRVSVPIGGSTFVEGDVVNVVLGNDKKSVPPLLLTTIGDVLKLVMTGLVALGLSP